MSEPAKARDTPMVRAALDWSAKIKRGEVETNPYITALADAVLELQADNERLEVALGVIDGNRDAWDTVTVWMAEAKQRISALEEALRPLAENWDLAAAATLVWTRGTPLTPAGEFRVLPVGEAREIQSAMKHGREVLGGGRAVDPQEDT